MYDSAQVYYKKKDFKKAAYFYDVYYIEQQKAESNYDTYYAAVAAAHVGNMDRAKYYLKRSAAIGYDLPSYNYFATDKDNAPLQALPEWKKFIGEFKHKADSAQTILNKTIAILNDTTIRSTTAVLDNIDYWKSFSKRNSAEQLTNKIKEFNSYSTTKKDNFWTVYHIKANDTLTIPFLVYIPQGYNPKEKTSLYVYLHGAVINRRNFANPAYIPDGLETAIMTKAVAQHAFIIYPLAKKDFGWLYQQQAFETVLKEITYVKSRYNINDDKIYIGGHSNGGSGAFWFALNQPSLFASFFGFNYLPKTYFGNTILKNLNNTRTFYGISGSEDTTFPLVTVNSIYQYGISNGANWKNFIRKGSHGLPFSSRDSINFIFDTLATRSRDPFPKKIVWETDNIKNGRYAWLEIKELDTLAAKAEWHQVLNPLVTQGGKTAEVNFNKNKSGAIIATTEGNTIKIESSRVRKIKLYLSTAMFNLNEKIKIIVNGKSYQNAKLVADKNVILEEFLKTKDRSFIVANTLELTVN
ncbi:MAG: alpha/beta hydrolase-fold protein [Bacteroidota bacterium]